MTGPCLHVRTPSRLHFGLLGWGPGLHRQFGGLGLMIAPPAIELVAEPSRSPSVHGPLAGRVTRILDTLRSRFAGPGFARPGIRIPPVSVRIIEAPPEHVGLGVGTQLSLAIAEAVARLIGEPMLSVEQLAGFTGRGCRSGIGLHGFRQGGFL